MLVNNLLDDYFIGHCLLSTYYFLVYYLIAFWLFLFMGFYIFLYKTDFILDKIEYSGKVRKLQKQKLHPKPTILHQ